MWLRLPQSSPLFLVTGSTSIFGAQQPATITSLLSLCHGTFQTLIVTLMSDVSQHLSDHFHLMLPKATLTAITLFHVPPLCLLFSTFAVHSVLCALPLLDFHYFLNIMPLNMCPYRRLQSNYRPFITTFYVYISSAQAAVCCFLSKFYYLCVSSFACSSLFSQYILLP